MNKSWLAVVLGILLGWGVAYAPSVALTFGPKTNLPIQSFEQQRPVVQATAHAALNPQVLVLALLIGAVIAAPFFLVAKRRSQ